MFGMHNERRHKDLVWLVIGFEADDSNQRFSTRGSEVALVARLNVFDGQRQRRNVPDLKQFGFLGMRPNQNRADLRRDFEVSMVDGLYAYHGCKRAQRLNSANPESSPLG
jgi:hypothetical protein